MSEVTGKLAVKGETKSFGPNGFTKREFVIETDSQYPQLIQIELIKDKCNLIDSIKIGDELTVSYNLNGRSWTNPQGEVKYFNSVQGWRIDKASQAPAQPPTQIVASKDSFGNAPSMDPLADGESEDLPFSS